ncbi:MAG: GNAT family N-acetyltransferase [Ginsengibacter sp.]
MEDNLVFREGSVHDVAGLQELGISSYSQFGSVLTAENWATFDAYLKKTDTWIDLVTKAHCFVCEDSKDIIGMAFLVPSGSPTRIYPADWSYIRMVGVDPGYRGRGIAKRLTLMCIHFAREANEKVVALHTSEFMDAARHIYESLGFEIISEIDPLFGKRYWLYKLNI